MRDLALLSEQQAELVRSIVVLGLPVELAAERSGYHRTSVYRTLRIPAVALAINEAIQFELQTTLAPLALNVARTLLKDDQVSARVRADLSFKILDRAGHIVPSNKQRAPDKALSEMTQSELLAFIERNQAEIDKAEGELAAAAKDVSAPAIAPHKQGSTRNILDYLD